MAAPEFSKRSRYTFSTVQEAAADHRLCLARCEDRSTGKLVYVICETFQEDGVVTYNPLAKLLSGNPYNEVTPPGISAPKLI